MIRYKFPTILVKIITSFLNQRYYFVKVGEEKSNSIHLTAGVPQGSSLSPILYNIFISDLPKPPNCELGLYADDTALISSSNCPKEIINNIENGFRMIKSFYYKWKIKINIDKTKAIFFSRKRKPCHLPHRNLKLYNNEIAWENESICYLGIHLDKKLLFKSHLSKTINKINFFIRLLYPLINRNSELNTPNKILIYKTIFRSILLYGFPIWKNAAKSNLDVLQKKQNKILKLILGKPFYFPTKYLHELSEINYINEQINKLEPAFLASCEYSDNPLVKAILDVRF